VFFWVLLFDIYDWVLTLALRFSHRGRGTLLLQPKKIPRYQSVDKIQQWVFPLYSHLNDERRIGTAMLLGAAEETKIGLSDGHIYEPEETLPHDEVMNK